VVENIVKNTPSLVYLFIFFFNFFYRYLLYVLISSKGFIEENHIEGSSSHNVFNPNLSWL
jgi:hypothetical protein